eukprot:CAMPEP_0113881306 /NCGR_PEP_ID=MMETSP0780_2-20120614/8297_1 /TAXON_ID=652834 /ORGANISM="Palpitomonas bilix" /LENGTH=341 /DNA_ID=CAMNT_0000868137 /DNA_START=226 /DNA_END=1251 /DNA_ORIENTATION=- /assembly_acc=CAM_ASM_000599
MRVAARLSAALTSSFNLYTRASAQSARCLHCPLSVPRLHWGPSAVRCFASSQQELAKVDYGGLLSLPLDRFRQRVYHPSFDREQLEQDVSAKAASGTALCVMARIIKMEAPYADAACEQATQLWLEAAERGHREGLFQLAVADFADLRKARPMGEVLSMFQRASKAGHKQAPYWAARCCAIMMRKGDAPIDVSSPEAVVSWLRVGATRGCSVAQSVLGRAFVGLVDEAEFFFLVNYLSSSSDGSKKNSDVDAVALLSSASLHGDYDALKAMGTLFKLCDDPSSILYHVSSIRKEEKDLLAWACYRELSSRRVRVKRNSFLGKALSSILRERLSLTDQTSSE